MSAVAAVGSREEWIKGLADQIRGREGLRPSVPRHVLERLASLLGLEAVEWVDSSAATSSNLMSGQVVLFTRRSVAVVTLDGIRPPSHSQFRREDLGSTRIEVFHRNRLTSVEMVESDETFENSASAWDPGEIPQDGSWPYSGRVDVRYEGRQDTVRLPLTSLGTEAFAVLVSSLIDDLE